MAGIESPRISNGWCSGIGAGIADENVARSRTMHAYIANLTESIQTSLSRFLNLSLHGEYANGTIVSHISTMMKSKNWWDDQLNRDAAEDQKYAFMLYPPWHCAIC